MLVAVLSDKPKLRESFCKLVGKEVSKDDVGVYSMGQGIWLVDPVHYPEKIQPLLYTLSMADLVVVLVDELSPKIGEILVALNSMNIERGIIASSVALPLSGTMLERYEKLPDAAAVRDKILATLVTATGENLLGLIQKTSNVASLGNVAVGALRTGKVRKQDKLFILPAAKDLEVRSIHVDGAEVPEIAAATRFEIAYKGELTQPGLLVPIRHDFQVEKVVNGRFVKSLFFRDELRGKIHAYTNMQFVEGHLTDNDLTLSEPLAFEKGESILVIDASNQKLRIAGVFQSKW